MIKNILIGILLFLYFNPLIYSQVTKKEAKSLIRWFNNFSPSKKMRYKDIGDHFTLDLTLLKNTQRDFLPDHFYFFKWISDIKTNRLEEAEKFYLKREKKKDISKFNKFSKKSTWTQCNTNNDHLKMGQELIFSRSKKEETENMKTLRSLYDDLDSYYRYLESKSAKNKFSLEKDLSNGIKISLDFPLEYNEHFTISSFIDFPHIEVNFSPYIIDSQYSDQIFKLVDRYIFKAFEDIGLSPPLEEGGGDYHMDFVTLTKGDTLKFLKLYRSFHYYSFLPIVFCRTQKTAKYYKTIFNFYKNYNKHKKQFKINL